jgi:hypothetical protein
MPCNVSVARILLYSISYMNERAPLSVSDKDYYTSLPENDSSLFSLYSGHSYGGGKVKHTYSEEFYGLGYRRR